ncbi:putative LRR receptor-like serine/threonine-protein kinase [Dorcoceras hygrometricum]|uniref:Putative LRR receptor-like serine/threonine-protein kinase n=1 Tax=Dorcoceras hygrometricum TaxID=472368 RepID=A0A2Z7A706_9LAMI|nr:putative LRR receptor-like serine/threonine-protein kinase [Dorcoceras hygrometricum]
MRAKLNASAEWITEYNTQSICLWKFGLQCPTSPLLPPRKVPLEDLIYTSCTDPIPQPAAARTPRLYQPSAVHSELCLTPITVACDWVHYSSRLVEQLPTDCDVIAKVIIAHPALALLFTTADRYDITADVIIADSRSCASS